MSCRAIPPSCEPLLERCARLERLLKLAKDAQFGRSPEKLDADQLQLVLEDSHLFEFLAGDGRWGIPDPDGDFDPQPIDARKTRLSNIVQETGAKTIHFLYDFGDSWGHVTKLEK